MKLTDMKKATQWTRQETTFAVEVSHHVVDFDDKEGKNRWCVYAHLNKHHPRFAKIVSDDIYQEGISGMPLHWGCTYCEKISYGGWEVWKIGSDYSHIDDRRFKQTDCPEDVPKVFADAAELHQVLLKEQEEAANAQQQGAIQ